MSDLRRLLVIPLATSMILSAGLSEAQQKPSRAAPKSTPATSRPATANATNGDPFLGVWKLNAKKSKYEAGGVPSSLTRTYEDRGGGTMIMTTDVATSQGSTRSYLVYKRDGKPYPEAALGTESFRMVTVTATDPRTEQLFFIVNGSKSETPSTISISPDGRTMTQAVSVKNAKGQSALNTLVFDKQP